MIFITLCFIQNTLFCDCYDPTIGEKICTDARPLVALDLAYGCGVNSVKDCAQKDETTVMKLPRSLLRN
jgi:hypothetical protein